MGSQESKSADQPPKLNENFEERELNDNLPTTPILTPLDPRSPSSNIARTPLELVLRSKTINETPADVVEDSSEGIIKNIVLNDDPRSPTVEFTRTPIIVSAVVKDKPAKLNNKNFDNVRKSTIHTTPTSVRTSIPPKLLGSSPLAVNPNTNKRRSLVGLLETNIDFTETNLDDVCKNEDDLNTVAEITEDCANLSMNEPESQMEPSCEELKTNGVEEPEVQTKTDEIEINPDHFKDNGVVEEKIVNITAHVKDFDKKLTNLIYQDESDDDGRLALKFSKLKENNRTPLGVRNSNEEPKKPASKLRVSDKPRKSENSKIPVLKDRKIGVQCENTPPSPPKKQVEEKRIRPKLSHWDGDKTLII